MTFEFALEPAVDGAVVVLNVMIESRLKLVGIEDLYGSLLPSCTDRLAFSHIDLDVNHPMRERFQLSVVVGRTIKN